MERVLARKPLTEAERAEPPCTVCVTGAAGYVASTIVCRLLAAGHTVHATYRRVDDKNTLAALKGCPDADRLKWFEADLMTEGSFDEALKGCKYLIHTAAPVQMNCPPKKAFTHSINPMVVGVANILQSVNRTPSIERVVMTSSIWSAMQGLHHQDQKHLLDERDFNLNIGTEMPYYTAKTLSEWEAWAITAQQDRWRLVVICPANILGPPLAACPGAESVASAKKLLDGSVYPFVPPLDTPLVDVADIATAHCLAMVLPGAKGRYIIWSTTVLATELAAMLREQFPNHRVPFLRAPFWLAAAVFKATGMLSYGWLKTTYGRRTLVSNEKSLRELKGLAPMIPLDRTLHDMYTTLIEMGLLPSKEKKKKKGKAVKAGTNGTEKKAS
ncbi:hypothetical protein N2152v2_004175 [Parachlorella kessleri]